MISTHEFEIVRTEGVPVYRKAEAKNPDGKGGYDGGISLI